MIEGFKHVRSISWQDVFSAWEKNEANLPHWIEHYTNRGFSSWKDWRNSSIENLNLNALEWNLYEISDPLATIPKLYAGPFRAWIRKYYGGKSMVAFSELAKNTEIQNDAGIHEIISNFPSETVLICLQNKELTVVDGLHRCCAVALAKEKGIPIASKVYVACAAFPGELPLLGQENSPT